MQTSKVQPQEISVPSLDALQAMEGQKKIGETSNFLQVHRGGEKIFFEKWGPKYKRHNAMAIRNTCSKFD